MFNARFHSVAVSPRPRIVGSHPAEAPVPAEESPFAALARLAERSRPE